jgi:hypothetical protein
MLPPDGSVEPAAEMVSHGRVMVLVPCYNEKAAIGKVVADFRTALPEAGVYIYDDNSNGRTVEGSPRPVQSFALGSTRERVVWSAVCSPMSMPIDTCWLTAMPPTMRPVCGQ